jgi:hypothetical protein
MMTGKQKLYFLLDVIVDIREITPSGQPLIIDPTNDLNRNYRDIELSQLFSKLENDQQILKVIQEPSRTKRIGIVEELDPYDSYEASNDGCYHIELLPSFDEYFQKIQSEPEYQQFTGKKPKNAVVADDITPHKPSVYERKALEKIWTVLQEIEEKRQIGTEGNPVRIPCYVGNGPETDEIFEARKTILAKLESLGALTGLHKGVTGAYYYWSFEIGNEYHNILKEYKKLYEETAHAYQQSVQPPVVVKDPVYEIKYSEKGRQILINNFLIAKPEFAGELLLMSMTDCIKTSDRK